MALRAIPLFRWLGALILVSLNMLASMPVAGNEKNIPPDEAPASMLRIAVATTLLPLSNDLLSAPGAASKRFRFISSRGEQPLEALTRGEADVALLARQIDMDEAKRFNARVFGCDKLLFVVHERNPLERISMATMRAILGREVSDWQQIGAGNTGAIVPVIRAPGSDTRRFVDTALGLGEVMPAGMVEVGSNLAAALYIAADPQAIGYLSSGAYEQARQRGLRMKALTLEATSAATPPGTNTSFPENDRMCRPLLFVQPRETAMRNGALLHAILSSDAGKALLLRHGFIPARSVP